MDNPFKSPAVLSLCTGMRGLERGIERSIGNVRTVAYVEIEAFIIENLVRQMEQGVLDPTPVWSNLKTFAWEKFRGRVHGITGGYPCQPFSHAGQRKGTNDPRHLWPFIKRGIKKSQPAWVFFENVEGHLSLGFLRVQKDLRKMGYAVEAGLFTAQEVGAPHKRSRLFILGVENSISQRMRRGDDDTKNWGREIQIERSSHMANSRYVRSRSGCEHQSEIEQEEYSEELSRSNERDNTSSNRQRSDDKISTRRNILESAGEELADTNHRSVDNGSGRNGFAHEEERISERHEGEEPGESDKLSYSDEYRRDESMGRRQSELSYQYGEEWPAPPGHEQYDWEEPRTKISKPSMGFTINGYNFREDLLRMAGNAVVEQTAELAFRTLLGRHGLIL